jgi:DNA modification methylase
MSHEHGSGCLDPVHPTAVEPSGLRLTNADTTKLRAERDRLVSFLRGSGSALALWLTILRLHAIAKMLKGEEPNVDGKHESRAMRVFVNELHKETGVDVSTIYRYRERAKKLVALLGEGAVHDLLGTVIANDDRFLIKLPTLNSQDKALEVVRTYIQGRGKRVASKMLDQAIFRQTITGLKATATIGSTVGMGPTSEPSPYRNVVLYGDVLARIAEIPDSYVQAIITSPPFFAVRDYGTRSWFGGDPKCEHTPVTVENNDVTCPRCGAWWGQLGHEPTIDLYIEHMVTIFRACHRILRDDGVMFVEIDDSYAGSGRGPQGETGAGKHRRQGFIASGVTAPELPAKNLCLVPERLVVALQAAGWFVRQRIVWHKTTGLGEPFEDRCSHAHSVIWMLTKSPTYYFDHVAIMEDAVTQKARGSGGPKCKAKTGSRDARFNTSYNDSTNIYGVTKRYARDVWSVAPGRFDGAHTATFPEELPRRCIEAATSEKACAACGMPYRRVVHIPEPIAPKSIAARKTRGNASATTGTRPSFAHDVLPAPVTIGFEPACNCGVNDARPCVVCDPFAGTGTTLAVARTLGRDYLGIELNEADYRKLIEQRLTEVETKAVRKAKVRRSFKSASSGSRR